MAATPGSGTARAGECRRGMRAPLRDRAVHRYILGRRIEASKGASPMIGTRRPWRIIVAIALGFLGTGIADGRCLAQERAVSLSASFRRAASRASGALVSVRLPGGVRVGGPYIAPRTGRFGPMPAPPQMFDRMADAEARVGFTGVVIDADKGFILTADSPTQGVSQLLVTFPDGKERLDERDPTRPPHRPGRAPGGHRGASSRTGQLGRSRQACRPATG